MRGKELTGKRFHPFTVFHRTGSRDYRNSDIWHVQSECGKALDVSYSKRMYSGMVNCDGRKKKWRELLHTHLTIMDGEAPEHDSKWKEYVARAPVWARGEPAQYHVGRTDNDGMVTGSEPVFPDVGGPGKRRMIRRRKRRRSVNIIFTGKSKKETPVVISCREVSAA